MQVAYETRTESAHHARADRFSELDELSFAELLSLEDDLSEGGQWSLLDDVRGEIAERKSDAADALHALFITACDSNGTVPMASGKQIEQWDVSVYLAEALSTDNGLAMAIRLALAPAERAQIIGALSLEYASEQAVDLLKAGWSAEQ